MPAYWDSWTKTCRKYNLDFNEKRFYSLAGITVREIMTTLVEESGQTDKYSIDEILETKFANGKKAVAAIGTPKIDIVCRIAENYRGKVKLAVASSGTKLVSFIYRNFAYL